MFETLPNPSLEILLLVGRALLLGGAFWIFALAFIRWRRADERSNERLQQQLERAFAEVRSLHETMLVMNARIESFADRAEVGARLAPGAGGSQRGYDIATRFAKNGADIDELIANCGVTRHEAELLVRLHAPKAPPVPQRAPPQRDQVRGRNAGIPPGTSNQQAAQVPNTADTAHVARAPASGRKRGSILSVVG